jgi:hypothetical protein
LWNLAVTPLAITVTADAGQNKVYGSANSTYTYINTCGGFCITKYRFDQLHRSCQVVKNVDYITGNLANSNYTITFNTANFAITP